MYREFLTFSMCYVLCFIPFFILGSEVLFWATLSWICPSGQPPWPPYGWRPQLEELPAGVSATGLKSCLQSWIFHLYLSESMLCFCLHGRGPRCNISFHHSSSSHIFFNLSPPRLPSWNRIPGCHCAVLLAFLLLSQSAHRRANPSSSYNGAWLKLVEWFI